MDDRPQKVEASEISLDLKDPEQTINDELDSWKKLLKKEKERYADLDNELSDTQFQLKKTKKLLDDLEKDKVSLDEQNQKQQQKIKGLEQILKNERIQTELRDELISELVSADNTNPGLKDFETVLYNDFMEFAAKESSLANEAEAFLKLQEIATDLRVVSSFPEFHTAKTIAVAGGFSAGKSEFISSLFKDESLKLPSSIEPTTAIPTYVIHSEEQDPNCLIGVNNRNGTVRLSDIDKDLVRKLNHNFIQSFKFPLKKIMPYMFLTTKMTYKHICFVDTPGYNPPRGTGSHTANDINIAQEFVVNANVLIWVIGADASGTIPAEDIRFLKRQWVDSGKPLYLVYNKADLKPKEDIRDILKQFKSILEQENIAYQGITAYNSIDRSEILSLTGKPKLSKFLQQIDHKVDKKAELLEKLYDVDRAYQYAILKEIKERKILQKAIDNVALDLNEANFARGRHDIYDRLEEIAECFNTREQEAHLKELANVIQKLSTSIEQVFGGQSSTIKRPIINDAQIETDLLSDEEPDNSL